MVFDLQTTPELELINPKLIASSDDEDDIDDGDEKDDDELDEDLLDEEDGDSEEEEA
jgi:hypothetical protein